jgi:hypothetical protein
LLGGVLGVERGWRDTPPATGCLVNVVAGLGQDYVIVALFAE